MEVFSTSDDIRQLCHLQEVRDGFVCVVCWVLYCYFLERWYCLFYHYQFKYPQIFNQGDNDYFSLT